MRNNVVMIEQLHKKFSDLQAKRAGEYDVEEEISILKDLEFYQS